jgi:hypothetical protein
MFTSIGEPRFHSEEAVRLNFTRVGMDRIVGKEMSVLARAGRALDPRISILADGIPLYNPNGAPERLRGCDFVPITREEAPLSYEFYEFLGYEGPGSAEAEEISDKRGNDVTEIEDARSQANSPRPAVNDLPHIPPMPTTAKRMRDVIRMTRQHGLGWLARRVIETGSRAFSD